MERKQNMSSPSPVTDGTRVYVMTGTGILKGFDFKGRSSGRATSRSEYGRFGLKWGYASSPLLHEDALFVQVLHGMKTDDPSYLLRIDKKTGQTVWRSSARPTRSANRPTPTRRRRSLQQCGPRRRSSSAAATWSPATIRRPAKNLAAQRAEPLQRSAHYRIVASPVVAGGLIIAPSRQNPVIAIRPGGRGDVTQSHKAWQFSRGPDVPTPVSDGTHVFIVTDNGVVLCARMRRPARWCGDRHRLKSGTYSASPVLADGRVYVTNEDGLTSVFAAGADVRAAGRESVERLHAQLARGLAGADFHPHRQTPLCDRRAKAVTCEGGQAVGGSTAPWRRRRR